MTFRQTIQLGVNIDHIATVRQVRQTVEPDPVWAAVLAELGGADGITVHLREDRRHIQDRDVKILRETVRCKLNLEMACTESIVQFACETVPNQATLVPEKRQEITTEGGLDVAGQFAAVQTVVKRLQDRGIGVSLFLDPDLPQIEAGIKSGCEAIEIHTGTYANVPFESEAAENELRRIHQAAEMINAAGVHLHAGHGLTYRNVLPIAAIPQMRELNIGHSIIARSLLTGLTEAVREMKRLISH
ncbi:MAG: pyridoxine 5'-phosphate synthase [Planctomycetaceae bacterium]|jgi:pyridoxine 5-phosphate synthase|nr:pyridoxine 5'-phosphate synthase [Planctomycetaceae bacterium]